MHKKKMHSGTELLTLLHNSFSSDFTATDTLGVAHIVHATLLIRVCEQNSRLSPGQLEASIQCKDPVEKLKDIFGTAKQRFGTIFDIDHDLLHLHHGRVAEYIKNLQKLNLQDVSADIIGQFYEECLSFFDSESKSRKTTGTFYTPPRVVKTVLDWTLDNALKNNVPEQPITILDPACGAGAFLIPAFRRLLDFYLQYWMSRSETESLNRIICLNQEWTLTWLERIRILKQSIYGIDINKYACDLTWFLLISEAIQYGPVSIALGAIPNTNIVCKNALVFDANMMSAFDVVIGNPPWGQRQLKIPAKVKKQIQTVFPSSKGIFTWFRPFIELGIKLTAKQGYFGFVLPDSILLKNYEPTRKFILSELELSYIELIGMAFDAATVDGVILVGCRTRPHHEHEVTVRTEKETRRLLQRDFHDNPRTTFNLYITNAQRIIIQHLNSKPKLGDYFEIREGVHSGNIRHELFVSSKIDDSCRELLVSGNELCAYELKWQGRYIHLGILPAKGNGEKHANVGCITRYEQQKVLVRRTGDRIISAVDIDNFVVSNNFFMIAPKKDCVLTLDGLCALLNSAFTTWYFRLIEPRRGKAFAELKIKHISEFKLPLDDIERCRLLNTLGRLRRELKDNVQSNQIDQEIDLVVHELFPYDIDP